ncbi:MULTISPECIES: STAS domain-containing protein [unclassified Streptomyces]|uniref:STAS domain-containing protein n=1 Tax=Streptomyces sp. SYP-A7185 TaxID=3040076 RepID=UPI0038F65C39
MTVSPIVRITPIHLTAGARCDGVTGLALEGELDLDTVARIEPELMLVTAGGGTEVVLDLAGVTFCDTSGVKLLLRLHRRCAADGVRLRLCHIPRRPGQVMRTLGVDRTIPCAFI